MVHFTGTHKMLIPVGSVKLYIYIIHRATTKNGIWRNILENTIDKSKWNTKEYSSSPQKQNQRKNREKKNRKTKPEIYRVYSKQNKTFMTQLYALYKKLQI